MRQRTRQAILKIIEIGILNSRMAARNGDNKAAWLECDHIHNLPALLRSDDSRSLEYYWTVERPEYERVCKNPAFKSSFFAYWAQVERKFFAKSNTTKRRPKPSKR
jgi:hypothetical protein